MSFILLTPHLALAAGVALALSQDEPAQCWLFPDSWHTEPPKSALLTVLQGLRGKPSLSMVVCDARSEVNASMTV